MRHKHRCFRCGCVWSHTGFAYNDPVIPLAHTCPNCGCRSSWCYHPYYGEDLPDYVDHQNAEGKTPFGSDFWHGPNRDALYWHLFRDHHVTSDRMRDKTHRELAVLHDKIHRGET